MDNDFEKSFCLCLLYSKNLKYILLKRVKNGKLDALLIQSDNNVDQIKLSKIMNKEFNLEIEPTRWQIVTTLQNIDRKWKIDVFLTVAEIDNINKDGFELINPYDLPDECHPNLKWLIPLSIDLTVFASSFNQILMK